MWEAAKARVLGIAENAAWDAIKGLFGTAFLAAVALAVGWMKGASNMALLNIFVVVFVSVLFLVIFIQLRRLGVRPAFVSADVQIQVPNPPVLLDVQPLKNAPYLSITGDGRFFGHRIIGDDEIVEEPEMWNVCITNTMPYGGREAIEVKGLRVEITYYDARWQRLFGPIQGCWIEKKGRGGDEEPYLNADPITLAPQDTRNLAIATRMSKTGPFFALGKESLPFYLWRNPAFELGTHYQLQVVLTADTVQRTLYYRVNYIEEGKVISGQVLLPEDDENA